MIKDFNGTGTDGFGGFFRLGPVVRVNLHPMHSLYFAPTVFFDIAVADLDALTSDTGDTNENSSSVEFPKLSAGLGFDFDIGYRLWLVQKPSMLFGISAGVDMSVPLFLHTSGFGVKIYAGATLSFGKRKATLI